MAATSPLLDNNQVVLSNLPTDTSGEWTGMNIYRSVNSPAGNTNYYEITSLNTADPASTYQYTDNATDASIIANGKVLSFNGPPVTNTTLLQNVVIYDSSTQTYTNAFPSDGTLQFTGTKGGNTLTTQSLTVNDTTTVKDLTNFLQGSLGIQSPPGNDPSDPIPNDSVTGLAPGVSITSTGQIEIVSDNGVANSATIASSALQFVPTGDSANTTSVSIPFNSTQTASGQGITADMTAYDSLGEALPVTITRVLEKTTGSYTEYRWYADCGQNDLGAGQTNIAVGTGTVLFDGQGNFISASNSTVSIGRAQEPSVKPLQFNLDFSQVSGLASSSPSLSVSSQDGSALAC